MAPFGMQGLRRYPYFLYWEIRALLFLSFQIFLGLSLLLSSFICFRHEAAEGITGRKWDTKGNRFVAISPSAGLSAKPHCVLSSSLAAFLGIFYRSPSTLSSPFFSALLCSRRRGIMKVCACVCVCLHVCFNTFIYAGIPC